jgi:hypothetical protein
VFNERSNERKARFEMLKMTDKYAFLREKTCTI